MDAPFFIVGASRSGTTLLRLILNAHSRLAVPDEMKYFNIMEGSVSLSDWQKELSPELYARHVNRFLDRRTEIFSNPEGLRQVLLESSPRNLRTPYQTAADWWAQEHGKERWGEKTPRNLYFADILIDMFPEARFLHIVRDPRAVVRSMNSISYYSGDTVLNALNWRRALREGQSLLQRVVPQEQLMTIRYEALVRDPESKVALVCNFLGERYEQAMLNFYEESEKYMGGPVRTPSIKKPVDPENTDKWKHQLSTRAIGQIESICAHEMESLGYKRRGDHPDLVGLIKQWVKTAYWHFKMRQHSHRRGYEILYRPLATTRARLKRIQDASGNLTSSLRRFSRWLIGT